ncbi:hypothetical protein [Trichocoleus sp. FACHB-262]|uniref:hypothetical protein n=1 Tax=Trichocoleus sp. FACHB-262 TaxID=2692869 RepID=UPI001683A40F|nr:hypothetical protein [Trichocoleus sp. FACHB-262]MBD2119378.1 hypothetical protein [Trichocoleus sp. FACHB-262]
MDAFDPIAPDWTQSATHAHEFHCPQCHAPSLDAQQVWLNRRSPVYTENHRRKWQEFYQCQCGYAWWAWSSDRPPSKFGDRELPQEDLPGFW